MEEAQVIDLAHMLRHRWLADGKRSWGHGIYWSRGGQPTGSISFDYDMTDPVNASLTLIYSNKCGNEDWVDRRQCVRLVYTNPPYGGRRWWMVCPIRHERIGKLYLPNGGDIFAGRKAWGLGYRSQRSASRDKPFQRLFALQRKLGCDQGWEEPIFRPKGMWARTFERHWERYWLLEEQCNVVAAPYLKRAEEFRERYRGFLS